MAVNLPMKFFLLQKYGKLRQAARAIDIGDAHLSTIVNGWRVPSKSERQKLVRVLGKAKFRELLGKNIDP